MNKTEILTRVPIFSSLSKDDIQRLADLSCEYEFKPNEIVIEEGENDRRLFITVEGELNVVKDLGRERERIIRKLSPFDHFGEMALIDDLERSASVVALSPVRLLCLSQESVHQEMVNHPHMTITLLKTMSKRVRDVEKSMALILGELLPICANCKKIRQKDGTWIQIEQYIRERADTEFTHGICPECADILYSK
jgi:CRP-like cAMP-binding protein